MKSEDILKLTALQIGEKIKAGEITSVDATTAMIAKAKETNPALNCMISIFEEQALEDAKNADEAIKAGKLTGALAGVPIAIKDNMCTKGQLTSCGSHMLDNFCPPYDATVVAKLKEAGMVIFGKTNMDEFAMGSTTETSFFGPTINPWGENRVPGGSSGGSAAAVAADICPVTLGSDTGGSIRQPASFCGVTGLKPTYGAVSRYGLVAFASSLDQIGPLGKDIYDVASVYNIICGQDKKDQTSSPDTKLIDIAALKNFDVKGLKIGLPNEYFGEGVDAGVKENVMAAVKLLESKGAVVETFEMPIVDYAIPTYYIIACAEACSNLSRYDGIKYGYSAKDAEDLIDLYIKSRSEGFGMEVKRRIMLGNFVLSSGYYDAYYNKALQAKALIKKAFDEAFEKYDVVIGPVAPTTCLKMGESLSDPLKMYLGDICTVLINIIGIPALSIPCGFDEQGLPVGMQLMGKHYSEQTLCGVAAAFQALTDYHKESAATAK